MIPTKTLLGSLWTLGAIAAMTMALPAGAQEEALKNAPHIDLTEISRAAVNKSLPLLQESAAAFREQTGGTCFSCHHQSMPTMVTALARKHSFTVDVDRAQAETQFVHDFFSRFRPVMEKAQTHPATDRELDLVTVDPSISVGYALVGLAAGDCTPDATTTAMARYLMRKQIRDGRWPLASARPPFESSEFTSTALAVRALQVYAPASDSQEANRRIALARTWLLTAKPRTTEDRAFQLLGLHWSHADSKQIAALAEDLCTQQQDCGGWGQQPNAPADAYATGQVLYALHEAASLATTDAAYRRGMFFLVATQEKDGSWLVNKRAPAVQVFVDTKFPHGNSQFISCVGTCWATMALSLALPETHSVAGLTSVGR